MEDRRPDPRVHADERKHEIVSPHGVVARHSCSDLARAQSVGREVEDGEENGGRLLHARVPPKWPLAVVLLDRRAALDGTVGDHMHALILAVVHTCPTRESQGEWKGL